jgi:polar amino acid transport system substrate-binding protein
MRMKAAAALAAAFSITAAAAATPLRMCADPDNLPFTKAEGNERGLYVEVAELVGRKLERPVEFVWWYTHNQRRALRNTILANTCDAVIALPADADYRVRGVQKSRPFMDVSYAVVAAPALAFKSLDDLRGKRLGLQFGTTPHVVFNALEGFTRSTTYREPAELFDALARGEIDAAFLWGPTAGWDNLKQHAERWRVTPVSGHDLAGQVVIGVRRDQPELAAEIDRALAELQPQIEGLAQRYRFPRGKPVDLSRAALAPAVVVVPIGKVTRVATDAPAAAAGDPLASGRTRFNSQCSHCHGTDAVSPLRERDLRRLKLRYDENWREVALTTIKNGRSDKGMPTWKDALSDAEIQDVMAFLGTLQK